MHLAGCGIKSRPIFKTGIITYQLMANFVVAMFLVKSLIFLGPEMRKMLVRSMPRNENPMFNSSP